MEKIYSESFEKLIKQWIEKYPDPNDPRTYIGLGNPNAKILLVGRECARDETPAQIKKSGEVSFADQWSEKIGTNTIDFVQGTYPVNEKTRRVLPGHTWVKYQTIYNKIAHPTEIFKYHKNSNFDFLKYVFATEMNPHCSLKSKKLTKEECVDMKERKKEFFTSEFVRSFPVVILACGSNYIQNVPMNWEINDTFGVEYVPTKGDGNERDKDGNKTGLPFWAHYDSKHTRLVINTYQLSGQNVKGALLDAIAKVVNDFARQAGIDLCTS